MEELRKLQIREAELLKELTTFSIRRASIIERDASKNQNRSKTEKLNIETQSPSASQAMKGEATTKTNLPNSLQVGDIVEYSGCPGFTH